jgi:cell division protease FtsH
LIASLFRSSGAGTKTITYTELLNSINESKVTRIHIVENEIVGTYAENSAVKKDEEFPKKFDFETIGGGAEILNDDLKEIYASKPELKKPVITYGEPEGTPWWVNLLPIVITFIMLGLLYFFMFNHSQNGGGKAMSFGRTNARMIVNDKNRKTFKEVAGADEEKEELAQIVDFLKNPKKYTDLGARIPKGVLLVGRPGTGKTLLAKAVAGEAGVAFFTVSGSDFVEMFVGVGASRVRDLFAQAKKNAPCIVFIDEIDAVGRQRGAGMGGGNDEREQTLNQLLVEMDGFSANESIIVMAATNRADVLDPALMRPGRFDRQIYVHVPDTKGREEIFAVHAKNKPLGDDIDVKVVAKLTTGFTGADLENMLNEAALIAAKNNQPKIQMTDIQEAITKVLVGPEKKSRVITPKDKNITAFHEAGHAVVARVLPNCDAVREISIVPRGMAAGYTLTLPDEDLDHMTRNKMLDSVAMYLAGRVAEELYIGDISTGALNDLQQASGVVRRMITEYGMTSELGPVYLGGDREVFLGRDFSAQKSYSEKVAAEIDDTMKKILENAYAQAKEILSAQEPLMRELVVQLLDKEKLDNDEFESLYIRFNPAEAPETEKVAEPTADETQE